MPQAGRGEICCRRSPLNPNLPTQKTRETSNVRTQQIPSPAASPSLGQFATYTVVAAVTAAMAAHASVTLALPIWAMFIGWVAYFTRGHSFKDGVVNLACVVLGVAFGVIAALAISVLMPYAGSLSFAIVVFGIACIVVSLRAVPVLNNVLAYFLGLIGFFAAHVEPTLMALAELSGASALGAFAAWFSQTAQSRLVRAG